MLDLLTNALGGGALGVLLRIGNGFFETWRADKESKLKIEEARAMAAIAADKAAWDAFTASQAQATAPTSTPGWAAAILTLFRPFITLLLLIIVAVIFFNVTGQEQADMVDEFQFAAMNCIGWWFGDRMVRKK
jgi:hypothetical protein